MKDVTRKKRKRSPTEETALQIPQIPMVSINKETNFGVELSHSISQTLRVRQSRIRTLMREVPDMCRTPRSTLLAMSSIVGLFVNDLVCATLMTDIAKESKTLTRSALRDCAGRFDRFDFLVPVVEGKIRIEVNTNRTNTRPSKVSKTKNAVTKNRTSKDEMTSIASENTEPTVCSMTVFDGEITDGFFD